MDPIWYLGLMFILLSVWGALRRRTVETQKKAMQSTAAALGFEFKEATDLYTENSDVPNRYWTWNVRNCISGVQGETKISIFHHPSGLPQDRFEYRADGSFEHTFEDTPHDSSGTHQETSTICILLSGLPRSVPYFTLSPESFLTRERGPGRLDINFERYPEFSKTYTLQADDVDSVKALFDHEFLTFFTRARVSLTACEGSLYLVGGRLKSSKEITDFLAIALTTQALLARSAARNLSDRVGDERISSKVQPSPQKRAAIETIAKEARAPHVGYEVERRIEQRGSRLLSISFALTLWGFAGYIWFDVGWRDGAFLIILMGLGGILVPLLVGWDDENSLISRLLARTSLGHSKMDPDQYEPWKHN